MSLSFYSARDLRAGKGGIWHSLGRSNEVVITNNGKPRALMIDVDEDNFDETLKAVRQARAIMAFAKMRRKASEEGYMTPEEIDAEIAAARREKKGELG